MMRSAIIPVLLVFGCSDGSIPSAEAMSESCNNVIREHRLFQREVGERAQQMKPKLEKSGAYPDLADAQSLMEFQTEMEAREKQFAIRLRDCAKAS